MFRKKLYWYRIVYSNGRSVATHDISFKVNRFSSKTLKEVKHFSINSNFGIDDSYFIINAVYLGKMTDKQYNEGY